MLIELTFASAIQYLVANNADLRAAHATTRAAESLVGVARGGYLPSVNGTLSYSESGGSQIAPGAVDQSGAYTASITASQNLFAGLATRGGIDQAAANARAARATLRQTKARVGYDLVNAFAGAVYGIEAQVLTAEIIRRREENLRIVTLRFQGGRENAGSVALNEAYLEQARFDNLQAANAARVAHAQLARVIGADEYGELNVRGDVPTRDPGATRPDFAELTQTTPDYEAARAQAEAAASGVTVARAGFAPQLNLNAARNRYGPDFFPGASTRWSFGASLTLPLFNGGRDFYTLRNAAEGLLASDLGRVNVVRQTQAKLEQAWSAYVEGVAKLKVDQTFRRAAVLRAEIARKKYNNGLESYDDWDVIENDLIARQKNYLTSKQNRALAEAAWNQGLGRGDVP